MKFLINQKNGVSILFRFENKSEDSLDEQLMEKEVFSGKLGEVYPILYGEKEIIYAGLGKEEDLTSIDLRDLCFSIAKKAQKEKLSTLSVKVIEIDGVCFRKSARSMVEGFLQAEYKFDKYLSKPFNSSLEIVTFQVSDEKVNSFSDVLDEAEVLMSATFNTRDLVNTPAIDMYPEVLADYAKKTLEPLGVKVSIFGKENIEELGMEAFLAVAKGSSKEPKLLVMEYQGDPKSNRSVAFVGKGLTYDSGGYCIKSPSGMVTMQSDMAGSATVIGAMEAIAKRKLEKNIVGIAALCENMISGDAYKTGDIIGSMAKKTIEIGNTDAEGRVTLADSLYYAATTFKPDFIVDLATLTGACIVALGDLASGAVTNNEDFMKKVKRASETADETIWELPSLQGYEKYIASDVADIKNTNKIPGAGTITAGLFLENFVEDIPWVHLDIAGTAWLNRTIGALPKGATGTHVKTLYLLAKQITFE